MQAAAMMGMSFQCLLLLGREMLYDPLNHQRRQRSERVRHDACKRRRSGNVSQNVARRACTAMGLV